eukprot:COSAG03_NODE_12803_length_530_cov_0.921114_1_plen_160_part_01
MKCMARLRPRSSFTFSQALIETPVGPYTLSTLLVCEYICSVCMSNAHGTFVCVCNTYIVRGRYWAKKILEWTGPEEVEEGSSPPQRALATAIYLNDKYLLLFCSPHCLSVCLSVRPSVCLPACLPACLSAYVTFVLHGAGTASMAETPMATWGASGPSAV